MVKPPIVNRSTVGSTPTLTAKWIMYGHASFEEADEDRKKLLNPGNFEIMEVTLPHDDISIYVVIPTGWFETINTYGRAAQLPYT